MSVSCVVCPAEALAVSVSLAPGGLSRPGDASCLSRTSPVWPTMWPTLEMLHSVPHLTMSLQLVPSNFNLTVAYLQSLMLIVAVLLAIGFATLVLIALFLCMVISFLPAADTPSNGTRLLCICLASMLFVFASPATAASEQLARGLQSLLDSLQQLNGTIHKVSDTRRAYGVFGGHD